METVTQRKQKQVVKLVLNKQNLLWSPQQIKSTVLNLCDENKDVIYFLRKRDLRTLVDTEQWFCNLMDHSCHYSVLKFTS